MKFIRLSIIAIVTIFFQTSSSQAGQKSEYFAAQCYNYVKSWLKFNKSKIDTKYAYWELEPYSHEYNDVNRLYCQLNKHKCEAAYKQKIKFYEVLPWGDRETHTHTCYFQRNGTVLDDGYMFRGLN